MTGGENFEGEMDGLGIIAACRTLFWGRLLLLSVVCEFPPLWFLNHGLAGILNLTGQDLSKRK